MTIRTLHDVPVLEPLAHVADKLAIDLVLFGSVAGRIAIRDQLKLETPSLFDVAEHVADIDVAHLGPPSQTGRVRAAIAELVPMASWFRWSIIDRAAFDHYQFLDHYNWRVPLRSVRIGSDPRLTDIAPVSNIEQAVGLVANPRFHMSPRSEYDTEASALFLYLDALADVQEISRLTGNAVDVAIDHPTVMSAAENTRRAFDRLKGYKHRAAGNRLWYRIATTAFRLSPPDFRSLINRMELWEFLEYLDGVVEDGGIRRLMKADGPAAVSATRHEWQGFRIPPAPKIDGDPFSTTNDELEGLLEQTFALGPDVLTDAGVARLEGGNRVIAALRNIEVSSGLTPSTPTGRSLPEEFVYLSMPLPAEPPVNYRVGDLTAVAIGEDDVGPSFLPGFASVSKTIAPPVEPAYTVLETPDEPRDRVGRWTIRLNLPAALNRIDKLHVYVVAHDGAYG